MKRRTYFLLVWLSALIVLVVIASVLPLLNYSLLNPSLWVSTNQFIMTIVLLIIVLSLFLGILVQTVSLVSTQVMRLKLQAILKNKSIKDNHEEDPLLLQLSDKVKTLTRQVQLLDNQDLVNREEIVEGERKRIARDLHDTVSQELFATSMILSGLSSNIASLPQETVQEQLVLVKDMIESAQRDLRILLLHLRPSELESKTLVEGFELILREVSDKSSIVVHFQHEVSELPKLIEEHLFRIAQEIISNTLRHAKAKHLDVYLLQKETELQLKMTDDGIGFQQGADDELSYGLQNIRERVEDMAGTIKIRTAPNKGVAIDIRIPLLKGKDDEYDSSDVD
ncbi:TPA: sensor histidine kinase [Streptococcus suis]|uniref:sensor histidine kinase n=1 Tax=Streptococcus parasuis TaxID=1501662 RepID=UPI0004628C53|nr:sensor histidine kinase [Streptococcus parasuis]NQM30242.1 sensor histidine kinase [Streptococcus suis]MDG4478574.1 sensor histidine kinase [Streptococcus parasuis]NQN52466.1 sensor histidine kinase [Streptococcus suis]NQN91276.1 sensor histidine kinase [Streptococcus suis]HEL1557274.1 sensor histidine kinase [Streptococcus suis]